MKITSCTDRTVPSLAAGTTLHQIALVFKGDDMAVCDQIAEEQM